MDDQGRLHVDLETRRRLEKFYGKDPLMHVVDDERVAGAADLVLKDEGVVVALAGMNRAQRLVFRSERRRGASERDALETARASLPR